MTNGIDRENISSLLVSFVQKEGVNYKQIAKAIGCSVPTLKRIVKGKTYASSEMLKQCGILFAIGYEKYSKLSKSEKEKISESIGAVGGAGVGFGIISSAISASGAVAGLSAAGISSGLAAIGAFAGGGMALGVVLLAGVPIAIGAAGYGVARVTKNIIYGSKLYSEAIDPHWETAKEN